MYELRQRLCGSFFDKGYLEFESHLSIYHAILLNKA